MGSHQPSSQHAPIRGITGTDSPYERGQIGEQVTKTGRKELIQVDFLNEYLLFEWRRLLARTCFLWLLMTALRLLSESDATFICQNLTQPLSRSLEHLAARRPYRRSC
jgi:hypothetical protein